MYKLAREVWQRQGCIFRKSPDTLLVGMGVHSVLKDFSMLDEFIDSSRRDGRHLMALFSYELKNRFEGLHSENPAHVSAPEFVVMSVEQVEEVSLADVGMGHPSFSYPELAPVMTRQEYGAGFQRIVKHLKDGDIYEVNFCQDFTGEVPQMDVAAVFCNHWQRVDPLHGGLFCYDGLSVISGSPERFIRYDGERLVSEPIKGTRKRCEDPEEDSRNRDELARSEKERSENIMIVDLVRNDLSRVAAKGSVRVDSLCEIRSFPAVHQMVSTISCVPRQEVKFSEILRSTFPMGSMTGAPKVSAMTIADQVESFRRGAYSGTIGYISPDGEFDFNVLIRTIIYDGKGVSCAAGGAITIRSDEEEEYQECLVKLDAIQRALRGRE